MACPTTSGVSPEDPPLVNTMVTLFVVAVHELEKTQIYDPLLRLRIYVTDSRPWATSSSPRAQ